MGFFFSLRGTIAGFWPKGQGFRLQGFRRTSDSCILAREVYIGTQKNEKGDLRCHKYDGAEF